MRKTLHHIFLGLTILLGLCPLLFGQGYNAAAVELANLREDVRMLSQRLGEVQVRLEQMERENNDLRAKSQLSAQSYATLSQLNEGLAELSRTLKSEISASKSETAQQTAAQIKKLAEKTNAALAEIEKRAKSAPTSPVSSAPVFSDDFSKEGIVYTVEKGDTLDAIARKTGGSKRDITNANTIVDPTKIQVGQKLFIPGGK